MKILNNITEIIGNTPLVRLNYFSNHTNSEIIAKCEFMNPIGSIKDRVGANIILQAMHRGDITKETKIIEATSGNTGIALASVSASLGLSLTLVMPESMSIERRKLLQIFGAELILTPASLGMKGAVEKAEELFNKYENAYLTSQFENKDNPDTHAQTTADEIIHDTNGKIDFFITGVGTGGTISGIAKTLKEKIPHVKIIAVEPLESAVLSGCEAKPHRIQGIGAGFIPKNYNTEFVDSVIKVSSQNAIDTAKLIAKKEGLLVGISSGANVYASKVIAQKPENQGKKIVTILADTGERYLSTELFQ
jgi:cysteine synthase A